MLINSDERQRDPKNRSFILSIYPVVHIPIVPRAPAVWVCGQRPCNRFSANELERFNISYSVFVKFDHTSHPWNMAGIPKYFHIQAPQIGFKPPGRIPALIIGLPLVLSLSSQPSLTFHNWRSYK